VNRLALFGFVVAVLLVIAGFAFAYWPAALIVAGAGLGAVCLLSDDGKDRGGTDA
jgi:hypothetical protein